MNKGGLSPNFISLPNRASLPYEAAIMNTLRAYENRWDILSEEHAEPREISEWDLVQGPGNANRFRALPADQGA